MKTTAHFFACLALALSLGSCVDSVEDYECTCTWTVGTMTGSETYDVGPSTRSEADAACDEYEDNIGGNAQCEIN